ncbi:MAG: hypothetical protein M1814_003917 [Vezdaea aestivalis]|nr:MAG: hypothetical protein M1814_003917 [Vezdaea aestivalis]
MPAFEQPNSVAGFEEKGGVKELPEFSKTYEAAYTSFVDGLAPDKKQLLNDTKSPEALLSEIEGGSDDHLEQSTVRKSLTAIAPSIDGLLRFGKALDVLCNAKPEVMCLLWGGLRIVIVMAKAYVDFFENIVQCVKTIGISLNRIRIYEDVFPDSTTLRTLLEELYGQIMAFCLDAKQLFVDTEARKKRRLIPQRLSIALRALGSSFNVQFEQTKEEISFIIDRIDKEAAVNGLQASKLGRDRAVQQWVKQDSEITEARAHRLDEKEEILQQQKEREEQEKWRTSVTTLWEEQEKKTAIILDHVSEEARIQLNQWLMPIDVEATHESILKVHHRGTCAWVLEAPEFLLWEKQRNSLLWIHAIPGAGKTVLASSVIDHVRSKTQTGEATVYYYFDYKDRDQRSSQKMMATITASLASKSKSCFDELDAKVRMARSAGRKPTREMVHSYFRDSLKHFSKVCLVVDALDECTDRENMLEDLFDLPKSCPGDLKLLVTSRKHTDIQEALDSVDHLWIDMEASLVQPDIKKFVDAEIEEIIRKQRIKLRDPNLQNQIANVLSEKSGGMFQWVKCQLDQIRKLKTDKAIKASLSRLPKGLDETYLRILKQLESENDGGEILQVQRLLRWLVHSERPLTVDELAEAISIDFEQTEFDDSAVLTEPLDLLKYAETLATLKDDDKQTVQLSHFSVKEFLLSDFVRNAAPNFYMGSQQANSEIAEVCLTYLCLSDFNCSPEDLEQSIEPFYLLDYASSEMVEHYLRISSYDGRPRALLSKLLSIKKPTLNFQHLPRPFGEVATTFSPIHFCASHGLIEQLGELLENGCDVNIDGDPYGTPVNFAVKFEQQAAVLFLLDRGADPNISKATATGEIGNNAIHWALDENHVSGIPIALIDTVLDAAVPIDVNIKGGLRSTQTPLHYAARSNRLDILKALLQKGSDIDAVDQEGRTPLAIAVEDGAIESASFLLDEGASLSNEQDLRCDSIRESQFSMNDTLTASNEAAWEVVTAFKSQAGQGTASDHWGFALGSAAREGKLNPLRELLDHHVNSSDFERRTPEDTLTNEPGQKLSNFELEVRIGTMFSALAPALSSGNLNIIGTLLGRMLAVLITLRNDARDDTDLELHTAILHDLDDSKFCATKWDKSVTYMAILIGYLNSAKIMVDTATGHNISAGDKLSSSSELGILESGWFAESVKQVKENNNRRREDPSLRRLSAPASNDRHSRSRSPDPRGQLQSQRDSPLHKLKSLCEQARHFWHAKRNTRRALDLFLASLKVSMAKTKIIGFLLNNDCQIFSLDRAGRTLLHWATIYCEPDIVSLLETHGAVRHAPPVTALQRIQASIIAILTDIEANQAAFSVTSVDLSRKSDWNVLGRYFYWGGDVENAQTAFETATTFDPNVGAGNNEIPPAYHFFVCDICHDEYREGFLLRGTRFVVRDSFDSDYCLQCFQRTGAACLPVPGRGWIDAHRKFHEEAMAKFEEIEQVHASPKAIEAAKNVYRKECMVERSAEVLEWLRKARKEWDSKNFETLLSRYKTSDVEK